MKQKSLPRLFDTAGVLKTIGAGSDIILTPNNAIVAGDYLVAIINVGGSTNISSRPASGGWANLTGGIWTLDGGINGGIFIDRKIATGSEPGSYTWGLDNGNSFCAAIFLNYRNVHGTQNDGISVAARLANPGATHAFNDINVGHVRAKVVYGFVLNRTGTSSAPVINSVPDGFSIATQINGATFGRDDLVVGALHKTALSTGAQGVGPLITSTSDVYSLGGGVAIRAKGT